jgi:peptidoglycan/LPS O-acetylase OafA/YrhL
MERPSYSTSKRHLWISSALAWLVIFILAAGAVFGSEQAVAFGTIALPSMVALIVALLGIHRGFGSVDMKTMAFNARDQPTQENKE